MASHVITIICGGRDYIFTSTDVSKLDALEVTHNISHVITGGASGADTCGAMWANMRGHPLSIMPAQWKVFGKRAGNIRNEEMLNFAKHLASKRENGTCVVIAFPGGRGTSNMKTIARQEGVEVIEIQT